MTTSKTLAPVFLLIGIACAGGAFAKEKVQTIVNPKAVVNVPPEVQGNCTKSADSDTTQCYQNFCKGQLAGNFNGNLTQPVCDTNAKDPTAK